MWSRRFLLVGILSGAVIAALTLAGIHRALVIATTWIPGWGVLPAFAYFGVVGILIYPACWYVLVFRKRDTSTARLIYLVAATYGACCLLLIGALFASMTYQVGHLIALSLSVPKVQWLMFLPWILITPLLAAVLALLVAGLVGIPFVAIAGPMALLHRAILLRAFGERNAEG